MKKKIGLILSILLFFTSLALALNDDIFLDTGQPESIEELSSKIESSLPYLSHEEAVELAESIQLIIKLEREVFLSGQIFELYEEEIVVAKQISEEPRKSLPREEKSLMVELERKERAERIRPAPVTRVPRPRVKVYSKKELEKDKLSVVIEKEQTVLIPAIGLKRFMVTNPKVLKAAREDSGKVSITGMAPGKTFLHIWDSEGRRTIKVTVVQKGYRRFIEATKRAIEAAKMDSFKVRYSFDRYRLNSKSKTASRSYHYTEWFHRLGVTGETPWGRTNSRFQYEGREHGGGTELQRDLTAWDFNLRGEDIEISVGDTGARFSDITLPSTSYQGIRFRNPDKKNINYDLVWGARGNRMWGYRVLGWDNENYFAGARGQVEPADFIHFNATLLRALEDEEDIGEYLYAGGIGLNFLDDTIRVEAEAARSKSEETDLHNHAYKIDAILTLKDYNLILKGIYRDIDPDFLLVTGSAAPYVGQLGCYFDADYHPFKYLRLTGEYNIFRNRYSFNPLETQRYNSDWRGTVNFDIGADTRFRCAIWNRQREGDSSPGRGRGASYQISHTLSLLPKPMGPVSLYFRYVPSKYKNLSDPTPNYRERKYGGGMRVSLLRNLYYDIGYDWHYRKMLKSAERGIVKTLSTGLRYSTQILDTPFYGSLNFRYKKEYDVMQNLPLTSGEDVVAGGGEIKYRPSSDFETYLRINYRHVRGVLDPSRDRRETSIYGGGSYLFDTTLRWGVGGSIRGFVFEDLNGNGQKDIDERGLSKIDVHAGEYRSTITSANGEFEFTKVKGNEILVMFDTRMLPKGYKPTTPNPQMVTLERGLVSEAYFGVKTVAEISGVVFNDVNMNGIFDDGDKGVREVLLALDDGTIVQTMASGHYRMEDVTAGSRKLTLDAMTVPPHLIPVMKVKRTIEVKEGEYYEENFPLYALRTIVGAVFIDKNGNNRFDAGEEGVEDVVVRCADSTAITDGRGRFFLKKLPGGAQEVSIDIESIPSGYELSVEPSRTVRLLPEGEIKENVNFALRKKK